MEKGEGGQNEVGWVTAGEEPNSGSRIIFYWCTFWLTWRRFSVLSYSYPRRYPLLGFVVYSGPSPSYRIKMLYGNSTRTLWVLASRRNLIRYLQCDACLEIYMWWRVFGSWDKTVFMAFLLVRLILTHTSSHRKPSLYCLLKWPGHRMGDAPCVRRKLETNK